MKRKIRKRDLIYVIGGQLRHAKSVTRTPSGYLESNGTLFCFCREGEKEIESILIYLFFLERETERVYNCHNCVLRVFRNTRTDMLACAWWK